MENLLTLETVTLINGLAIQHSGEWEDYVEMNAQIHGLTKEEYTAYYLGTQWQMQCMESLQMLAEKKVTRKQLDKAINDVAKITNDLKKVVKEWAAARDAGKTEKQEEKLQELKKLNDEKSAAQDVVDDHIQQLDKNATLQTTESVNEDALKDAIEKEMEDNKSKFKTSFPTRDLRQILNTENPKDLPNSAKKVLDKLKKKYKINESVNEKKYNFDQLSKMWMDIYGEDMKDEYDGFFNSIKEAKYRETRHQSTDFSKPGNDGDIYFSKREGSAVGVKRGDKLQMIYVFQKEPKLGKIQKSDKRWENMGPASEELLTKLRGREEGKILFKFVSTLKESMNEKIQVASLEDAIDSEQDGDLNKRHLDKILKLKAAKRMHTMTRSEEKTYQAILRKYKIATDDEHVGGMMEAIDIDMVNTAYGFWGTMSASQDEDQVEIAIEDALNYLMGSYKFTEEGAYNFLNSKWGRKLADEYYDGEHYNMVDAIDAFTTPSTYKKYAKQFNEAKENTMKNLETLESFTNEAAPKLKTSKEEAGLLKLRDEIRRSRKGGSASNYSKEFDAAKKKALKAVEDMITYAKIGV